MFKLIDRRVDFLGRLAAAKAVDEIPAWWQILPVQTDAHSFVEQPVGIDKKTLAYEMDKVFVNHGAIKSTLCRHGSRPALYQCVFDMNLLVGWVGDYFDGRIVGVGQLSVGRPDLDLLHRSVELLLIAPARWQHELVSAILIADKVYRDFERSLIAADNRFKYIRELRASGGDVGE